LTKPKFNFKKKLNGQRLSYRKGRT